MSIEKDACMTDITETHSTVDLECSQIKKRRKKKRLERSWDASCDSLPENTSGGKDNCVNEAGVDANSKEISDRTLEMESVTLQEGVKKKKKRKKGSNTPQPDILLPSQEEGQLEQTGNVSMDSVSEISATKNVSGESVAYVNPDEVDVKPKIDSNTTAELIILPEGGKGRKKRKKDLYSPRPAELLASKDEEQLEMMHKISSDSQAGMSATENTVDGTIISHIDEDVINTKSENDLNTTQATETATFQERGKKKKKRKKDLNTPQPAGLLSPQGNVCLEKAQNIGINQDIISATENKTNEKDSYVDEVKVDINSLNGLSNTETEKLGTCQEGGKKKKSRKKVRDSSHPTELISSQVEGQLEKIENASSYSHPESSETGNHLDEGEVNSKPKIYLSATHDAESVTLQKGGKKMKMKKKKEDSSSALSTELDASQEKGTLESTQNVGSNPQADLSETENTFTGKHCCVDETESDANPTKDLNRSQSTMLVALQEEGNKRKKKQETHLNCSHPVQLPTRDEGERKKKRKKDSNSLGLRELHESQGERDEKTHNVSSDSQPGLSARDNASIVEHSCMNETDVDTNKKIDANSSQASESIELHEEGRKRKKHNKGLSCLQRSESAISQEGKKKKKQKNYLNDAQLVVLPALQEGDRVKKKRKKHLQDLNPTELSLSPEGGVAEQKPEQNITCQDEEDTHANGAEADMENTEEMSLTLEEQSGSLACIGIGSTEKDDSDHKASLVSVEETTMDCVERGGFRVYSRKMRILDGSIECGSEPIIGHMSGEHSGDGLMKNALNGEHVREEYTSAKAVEFVFSDSSPSKFSKEDVLSEGIKKIAEREDEVIKIARRSLIDHSNDIQPTETVDMMPGRDLLAQESTVADAVKMVGVKDDSCLDDCPKETILEADRTKKKQKLMLKDGIITSEGKGGLAGDAVKASVEAKGNIGVLQVENGSLIHECDVPSGKDDCDGGPGTSSVELTDANDFLKKDEVRVCSMKSIKHDGHKEAGMELITGDEQTPGGQSKVENLTKFMRDVLIGGQAGEHSALTKPVILTDCSKEGAVCEELERTSERGNEVTGRISEDCSNVDHLGEHSASVKRLEMTLVKNTNASCSNIHVSQKESETTSEMMNGTNVHVPTERAIIPRALKTPIKGPHLCDAKKLLILDVNGLLADIIPHSERPRYRKPDFHLRQKSVYLRPYCVDFLNFCFKNFEVGVWSSRKRNNLSEFVKFLFGSSKRDLLFCWDRSFCTILGLATVDNPEKPLVLKELKRLWGDWKNCPWSRGRFDASNTLLLDDSPYKALRNPVHTAVFPHSYKCTDDEDSSLGPEGEIRNYLERLITAPNVQEFVSQNPFGQKPIRASDPSWPFYRKIIIGDK